MTRGPSSTFSPTEPVRGVLEAVYGWYRTTEAMAAIVQRDRRLLPDFDALLAETADRELEALVDEITRGLGRVGERRFVPARCYALGSSSRRGSGLARLSDAEAADLVAEALKARAALPRSRDAGRPTLMLVAQGGATNKLLQPRDAWRM